MLCWSRNMMKSCCSEFESRASLFVIRRQFKVTSRQEQLFKLSRHLLECLFFGTIPRIGPSAAWSAGEVECEESRSVRAVEARSALETFTYFCLIV